MITISKDNILRLHTQIIEETGGSDGLRDEGLLDSALYAPMQTFDGEELYPTVIAKIARTAYSLINNHPFVDGNKRIGTYVMLTLFKLNHIVTDLSVEDVIKIGTELAGGSMSYDELVRNIQSSLITKI